MINRPKIEKFYRFVRRYRAIVFTVSENCTEKPDETVKKVDKRWKFDKFIKYLPYLDHF